MGFSLILRAFFSFPNERQFIECQFFWEFRYWVSFFDLQFQAERLPSFLLKKGYRFSICYRFHFTSNLPENLPQRKARNQTLRIWFRAYFYISVVISVPFLKVKTTLPSE